MRRTSIRSAAVVSALLVGVALGFGSARLVDAQAGIQRTILLKSDLAGIEGKEGVLGVAEIAPGAVAGKHSHPGEEMGYVLDGTMVLDIEGQGPIELKPGVAYHIGAGKAHTAQNMGTTPVRVLAVWIVDKDKPLATPVK